MPKLSDHARGSLYAAGGITIVSPDGLLIRLITADALAIVFWRGVFTAAVLFAWILANRGRNLFHAFRAVGWVGLLAAGLHTLASVCFVAAVKKTTVASVLVITGAEPLLAAILSALLLKERISFATWASALVVLLGLGIVFHGGLARGGTLGNVLATVAMASVALRYVLFRSARKVDMLPTVVLSGVLTAIVIVPFVNPFALSARDLMLLFVMGGILLPLGQMLLVAAPRYIPVPQVALIILLEAVLGPTWVWLALGEVPGRETVVGGILILGTVAAHFAIAWRRRP